MGIFSAIGSLFGGPGQIIGTVADGLLARDDAKDANSANAANARTMRQTAYQDTVQDLNAAGLNPMLAYSNGPTSGNMPPMQNKGLQAAQQTSAESGASLARAQAEKTEAETENARANTALIQAQTAKTLEDVNVSKNSATNISAQTDQIQQNISNLKQELHRIATDTSLKYQQTLTEVDRRELTHAQAELAKIDQKLRQGQITNIEAQTEQTRVITSLKRLEIPGLTNDAEFEIFTNTGKGSMVRHGQKAAEAVNSAVKIFKPF